MRDFVGRGRQGLAFIFISHKLQEIIDIATEWSCCATAAWRAQVVAEHRSAGWSTDGRRCQAASPSPPRIARRRASGCCGPVGGDFAAPSTAKCGSACAARSSASPDLEGSGQKEFLHALLDAGRAAARRSTGPAKSGFIAGDRQKEGVFPLWSVLANTAASAARRAAPRPRLGHARETEAGPAPAGRLRLDDDRFGSNILELSGGNQQKALVARALTADAPMILLDDPTRGVDIATKQDFYRLCNEIAAAGRHAGLAHDRGRRTARLRPRAGVFRSGQGGRAS